MIKKIILIGMFIFLLAPIYFMLIGSFQDIHGVMKMPPNLFPRVPTLANYITILKWDIKTWSINTLIVFLCTVGLSVFTSCAGAYVFAFYKFKLKKVLWILFLIGIMIPRISLIIPLYVIIKKLGISGSLLAVILPTVFSPVGLYLARNYFETVPTSLLESARLDGANEFIILRKIVMPVSMPIVAALSVFSGIASLQDYLWQSLILQSDAKQTLLVGLLKMVSQRGGGELNINPIGKSLAVGMILLIPLLLIFVLANKYFIESIGGAVKE